VIANNTAAKQLLQTISFDLGTKKKGQESQSSSTTEFARRPISLAVTPDSRLFVFHFNSRESTLLYSSSIPDNPDSLVFHFNSRQSRLFVFHFNSRQSRLFVFHFNSRQLRISHKELRNRFHSLYDPLSSSSTQSGADVGIVERKASEVRNLYFRCAGGAQRAES
jgi:hypothetical protein